MKTLKTVLIFIIVANVSIVAHSQVATYEQVVSKKITGSINKYITQKGEEFSIGDTITLGVAFRNEKFDFIQQNAGIEFYPLPNTASGSQVIIKNIKIRSKLVTVNTTRAQGFVYGLMIINFENAITNGEVKSKIMSSDEALAELKKWKDKFDLGLISEEDYNKKKSELSKLIN